MEFVLRFFYNLTGNYGISIILLTVVIRLALYPVIHKQNLSARAMQELQPEIKKLQEKYGKDPQRLNQEVMKLYREKGVSPLGGCLPLLIQLPFLFVLYRVLVTYDYGQAGFLWLPSLSQRDPYYILPLAMGATTFWQQRISAPPSGGDVAQQNLLLMVVMPVFLVFISWGLPSGVLLYWFVSNLFYIFQQYMLEVQLRRARSSSPAPSSSPPSPKELAPSPQRRKGGERREKKR
jgi:YidC/Oxa1 family membrane protein insertase